MKLNANEGSYKFHYPGPFIGKVVKKKLYQELGLLNSTGYMCIVHAVCAYALYYNFQEVTIYMKNM